MKAINKNATEILNKIVSGINGDLYSDGDPGIVATKKINNSKSFMAVSVECLQKNTYSVCHYYEQNGDLMRDPEVVFLKDNENYYPIMYQQDNVGLYQDFNEDPTGQAGCADFCNMWMNNIKEQQNL